ISLNQPGSVTVEANEAASSGRNGIEIFNSGFPGGFAVLGNPDLSKGRGNKVHDNAGDGILVIGRGLSVSSALVAGNTAWGNTGFGRAGIDVSGGVEVEENVAYG